MHDNEMDQGEGNIEMQADEMALEQLDLSAVESQQESAGEDETEGHCEDVLSDEELAQIDDAMAADSDSDEDEYVLDESQDEDDDENELYADDLVSDEDEDLEFSSDEDEGALEASDEELDEEEAPRGPKRSYGFLRLDAQVESIIFASQKPVKAQEILELLDDEDIELDAVESALANLMEEHARRRGGFGLRYVKRMGYQFQTAYESGPIMARMFASRPRPISRAALETLSIIAYRQPVTRAEIEFIRGVDAGSIVKNLLEREMVKCVGRKEVVGRPMLFGTTDEFLKVFNLSSIKDLPSLESFQPSPELMQGAKEKLTEGTDIVDVEKYIADNTNEVPIDGEDAAEIDEENLVGAEEISADAEEISADAEEISADAEEISADAEEISADAPQSERIIQGAVAASGDEFEGWDAETEPSSEGEGDAGFVQLDKGSPESEY